MVIQTDMFVEVGTVPSKFYRFFSMKTNECDGFYPVFFLKIIGKTPHVTIPNISKQTIR